MTGRCRPPSSSGAPGQARRGRGQEVKSRSAGERQGNYTSANVRAGPSGSKKDSSGHLLNGMTLPLIPSTLSDAKVIRYRRPCCPSKRTSPHISSGAGATKMRQQSLITPLVATAWTFLAIVTFLTAQAASAHNDNRSSSSRHAHASAREARSGREHAIDAELEHWHRSIESLEKRQELNLSDPAVIATLSFTDPLAAAKAADAMPYIAGNSSGGSLGQDYFNGDTEGNQYPWTEGIYYEPNPATGGDPDNGWQAFPQLNGFTINNTFEIRDGAVQPFYINADYDPEKIKRAIMVTPGKSRDSWKYVNMVRNSLYVQETIYPDWNIHNDSVLMLGIVWANDDDQKAGAVTAANQLVFHGSQWQSGGNSRSPVLNHSITSYEAADVIADWLFNKTYFPNLNQVVFVGHSMGGQMSQRYALLKKTKAYDPNMKFWVGNPGSYAWLIDARPYPNASCDNSSDWHYGLTGNKTKVSKYARKDVTRNRGAVVDRFLTRKVHYAYGLLDNGAGDTHCQAAVQGGNHLDRGSQFVMSLPSAGTTGSPNAGIFPLNQTASFVVGVSHQDYPMLCANASLEHIFHEDWDVRYPDLTNTTNPGDRLHNQTQPTQKPHKFATPLHQLLAATLLGGSVGVCLLFYALLPFVCSENTTWQEQEGWEREAKARSRGF